MIDESKTVDRLKKILRGVNIYANFTLEEKGELVSQIESRRNYIGFDLFNDYLKS